jgi:L-glyceraldehyde 3-phosphate reductase
MRRRWRDRAVETLYELGCPPIVCQAPYSVLNPWVEDALLGILDSYRVSFVADNPLATGELDTLIRLNRTSGYNQASWQAHPVPAADVLTSIAEARGQSLSQLAMSWVLRDCYVSSAIITPETTGQLDDLCAALAHMSFTSAELESITDLIHAGQDGFPQLLNGKY